MIIELCEWTNSYVISIATNQPTSQWTNSNTHTHKTKYSNELWQSPTTSTYLLTTDCYSSDLIVLLIRFLVFFFFLLTFRNRKMLFALAHTHTHKNETEISLRTNERTFVFMPLARYLCWTQSVTTNQIFYVWQQRWSGLDIIKIKSPLNVIWFS